MENFIWYTLLTLYGAIGLLSAVGVTATTLKYWKYSIMAYKEKHRETPHIGIARIGLMYLSLPLNFVAYFLAWPLMFFWFIQRIRAVGGIEKYAETLPKES